MNPYIKAMVKTSATMVAKKPTLKDVVESHMHKAWTNLFDNLHAKGYMGTKERIFYSDAIGKFLSDLKLKRNFKIDPKDVPFVMKGEVTT